MTLFRILFVINALAAAVLIYFFLEGLSDGTVSSYNGGLWAGTLAALAAILGGGLVLNAAGKRGLAIAVLLILAIPATLFGLWILAMIVLQPRWN